MCRTGIPPSTSPNLLGRELERRGNRKQHVTSCLNKNTNLPNKFRFWSPAFPSIGQFPYEDDRWEEAYNTKPYDSCTEGKVRNNVVIVDAVDVTDKSPKYCCKFLFESRHMHIACN